MDARALARSRVCSQYWHRKNELIDCHHANGVRVRPLDPPTRPLDRRRSGEPADVLDDDGLLEPGLNECFVYHGTSANIASVICRHGFDERVAALSGLYGAGIYFANQSCKASHCKHRGPRLN